MTSPYLLLSDALCEGSLVLMGVKRGDIIKVALRTRPMFQALEDVESFKEGQIYNLLVRCIKSG